MTTILLLAHAEPDGTVGKPAREALGAALALCGTLPEATLSVGVIGERASVAAGALSGCGAQRLLAVEGAAFAQPRYASDVAAAVAAAKAVAAAVVIVPATARWNRVVAGAAHRLGGRAETHVTGLKGVDGVVRVTRWYYRQRMEAVLTRTQRPWFLAVESGVAPGWSGGPGALVPEAVEVALPSDLRTEVLGTQAPAADQQTIRPEAEVLLVAGAGWTKKQPDGQVKVKEAAGLILDFLRLARASLGSSKSLVDLGGEGQAVLPFLTHLNQIGQTGATPRHAKGLSTCCHGEEPHTVGWRFINERRAISLDPNCGWARGKADVLYVADAFAVMAEVNRRLQQA